MRHQEAAAPSTASISGSKRNGSSTGRCNMPSSTSRIAARVITTCSLRQSPVMLSSWLRLGATITAWSRSERSSAPSQRKMLACQTRVRSDAAFYFDVDSTLCSASGTRAVQARVSEVELLSASTALLHLEAGGDSPLDFLPGQYARLQVPGTEAHRAYSFANRPNAQNRLLFLIRLLPGG